jgi:small subunit ribosomal protein S6
MSKPANRTYSATFLLDTRGYTEPVDTLVAKMRDAIIAIQGEVTKVENHGQREFQRPPSRAYPNGIFVTFNFTGPISAPAALREKVRLDPHVNRLLVQSVN